MKRDLFCLQMFHYKRAKTFATCGFLFLIFDLLTLMIGSAWLLLRLFAVCIILSLGGGLKNLAMQILFCYSQRQRIAGLDYGAFDPPRIRAIKVQLNLKFNLEARIPGFSLDLPLPQLSLPDLLELLPDLPNMPGFDLELLKLDFPSIDLPDMPNVKVPLPSFSMPFDLPGMDSACSFMCECACESMEELVGAVLQILLAFGEVSLLTDMALDKKKAEVEAKKQADAPADTKA